MRLRNIPGADDVIQKHPIAIKNEKEQKGNWSKVFGNDNPIHIEIGMGKGQFLLNLAKQNPNIKLTGIYTHLSSADNDTNYTNKQLEIFKNALKYFEGGKILCPHKRAGIFSTNTTENKVF